MQTLLTISPPELSDFELNPAFNIVIASEDFETGKQAKKTYDYLVEHLGHECHFTNQMWKFELLAMPKLREMAAQDAATADFILISAHGTDEFPAEVKAWFESWLAAKSSAIGLIALFDPGSQRDDNRRREYLANVARRGKMEFFAQPGPGPGKETASANRMGGREGKAFSLLAGMVAGDESTQHWSINE